MILGPRLEKGLLSTFAGSPQKNKEEKLHKAHINQTFS